MGVSRATFPRDEGWHFLNVGQALERAEMTARIVDVQYHTLLEGLPRSATPTTINGWPSFDPWRRTSLPPHVQHAHRARARRRAAGSPSPAPALAALFSTTEVQAGLRSISGSGPGTYANEAERLTGKVLERLRYDKIGEIFELGLHQYLSDLLHLCHAVGDSIARTYFYYGAMA